MNTKNILITGSRAPSTLFLIRKLAKAGYRIIAAESCDYYLGKYSSFVAKKYKITAPNDNFEKFIKNIVEIIKKENINLIIPTCEEIFHISKGKDILERYCQVFCDDSDKLIELHNKWSFYNKIKNSDYTIKLPQSWRVENLDGIKKVIEKDKKYILKPIFSRFATKVAIIDKMPKEFKEGKYILQEFIKGEQFCSYSIIKNNNLCLHSDYKTTFSADGGATIAFQYAKNQKILDFIQDFSKKENFEGQIAFDFIQNEEGLYLIECNPRLTSGIQVFDEDISKAFVSDEQMETCYPKEETKSILFIAMLIYGLSNVHSFEDLIDLFKTLFSSKDAILDKNDIMPFLMQGFVMAMMIISGLKKNINLKEISTYDIEWNGND